MSEEQMPSKTPEEIKEIMQGEEFQNDIHNMMLAILEQASNADALLTWMDSLTFDNLTPEVWAKVVNEIPSLRVIVDLVLQQVKASAAVFGEEEAIGVISKLAAEAIERDKEN